MIYKHQKAQAAGEMDGSVGQSACWQAWQPEFESKMADGENHLFLWSVQAYQMFK